MTWSRIIDTPLGQQAYSAYQTDARRSYHNWAHIERLYWHAQHTFALDYDPDLDVAILAHDVIYDALPDKELRSSEWLRTQSSNDSVAANTHILKTIEHRPSADNRMVLLDLADFLFPDLIGPNLDKIQQESCALYGIRSDQFLTANKAFMLDLHSRIKAGLGNDIPADDQDVFGKILKGIQNSIDLAESRLTRFSN